MIYFAKVFFLSFLAIWVLWIMYVCVMRLQMMRDARTLTTGQKIFGYPTLIVGLILDLVINIIICSIVFLEVPKEFTVSARLWRHSESGSGWRKSLAKLIRVQLLDSVDPDGIHKG